MRGVVVTLAHGRSRDFFVGGGTQFKKFFKKYSKRFQSNFKNFRTILKIFVRKILKLHYFSIGFSQANKARGQFLSVWTKNAICRKWLSIFSKIFKNFLKKIAKMHYFSRFFRKFKKLCFKFFPFGRKRQFIGNIEKTFEYFDKSSSENS